MSSALRSMSKPIVGPTDPAAYSRRLLALRSCLLAGAPEPLCPWKPIDFATHLPRVVRP